MWRLIIACFIEFLGRPTDADYSSVLMLSRHCSTEVVDKAYCIPGSTPSVCYCATDLCNGYLTSDHLDNMTLAEFYLNSANDYTTRGSVDIPNASTSICRAFSITLLVTTTILILIL